MHRCQESLLRVLKSDQTHNADGGERAGTALFAVSVRSTALVGRAEALSPPDPPRHLIKNTNLSEQFGKRRNIYHQNGTLSIFVESGYISMPGKLQSRRERTVLVKRI